MKNQNNKDKKSFIKTKVKPNNSIEVEIQKNPAHTLIGKIFIYAIIIGMALLGVVGLAFLMFEVAGKI